MSSPTKNMMEEQKPDYEKAEMDLLHLWEALNRNGVQYIMVGGVATNLHGYKRSTWDRCS